MNKGSIGILVLLLLASLAAVVGLRQGLGLQIDPFWIFSGLLAMVFLLVVIAKHPAAFMAPMLFAPRLKDLPIVSRFEGTRDFTALTLTAGIVCVALFLRLMCLCRRPSSPSDPFKGQGKGILAYLLFATLVSLSYLYSPTPDYGGDKLLRFLTFGTMSFFAPFVLVRGEEDLRDFAAGIVCFALAAATKSLGFSHEGATGVGENATHIGVGQLIGMAILILLYYRFANRRLRALSLLICIPWLAAGLVSAEARGPIFSVLLVLGLGVLVPRWDPNLISRKLMVVVSLAIVAAVLVLAPYWFRGSTETRFLSKTTELTELAKGSTEAQGTATRRLVWYGAALDAMSRHPVFGWGVGGWSMYYWNQDDRHYPHNLFLEVGVEEGLLGVAALLVLLGTVFQTAKRGAEEVGSRSGSLLPVLIYVLSVAMFSGDIDDNRFLWFWCGMVLACCRFARPDLAENQPNWELADGRNFEGADVI
jgi:O-antigen ligase